MKHKTLKKELFNLYIEGRIDLNVFTASLRLVDFKFVPKLKLQERYLRTALEVVDKYFAVLENGKHVCLTEKLK